MGYPPRGVSCNHVTDVKERAVQTGCFGCSHCSGRKRNDCEAAGNMNPLRSGNSNIDAPVVKSKLIEPIELTPSTKNNAG